MHIATDPVTVEGFDSKVLAPAILQPDGQVLVAGSGVWDSIDSYFEHALEEHRLVGKVDEVRRARKKGKHRANWKVT